MAYSGKPFFKIPRPLLLAGGVESKTISDGHTLTDKDSLCQIIDGGLALRNIVLPAEKSGRVYCIKNSGSTNNLEIQNDSAVALTTLTPGQSAIVACDETTWHVMIKA